MKDCLPLSDAEGQLAEVPRDAAPVKAPVLTAPKTETSNLASPQGPSPTSSFGSSEGRPLSPRPPDGGLTAWLQVLAGHLVLFSSWGYILSFGIFQPYYAHQLSLPPSAVAWIGSVQIFLFLLIGTFAGWAFDAGYFRTALAVGCLMQVVGVVTTSVASTFWQLFLAEGLCQGLGCGIVFAPVVANVSTYFTRKRSLAISLVSCGGATGGIVFPLIAQQLLPRIGFGWTVRVMGLVILVLSVFVLCIVRTRMPPRPAGPVVDLAAFKETRYVLFASSMFFTLWATYFAYYYARAYVLDILHGTQSTSLTILLVISAVGIPGRLVPALLADLYFGAVRVFIAIIFGAAVCIFAWIGVDSLAADYVWVCFYGFFGAAIQSMFPSTLAGLSTDLSKNGTRIGMVFSIVSVAALTGPPLAGKLIEAGGGHSYLATQIWGGACLVLGGLLLIAAQWAKVPQEDDEKGK